MLRSGPQLPATFASTPLALGVVLLVVAATLAGPTASVSLAAQPPARPNILLIFVDDLGYGELGCQGNEQIPSPNIDSLARDGIRFTSGYVAASYCSPSRAGLMTGRFPARFGYDHNPVGRHNLDPAAGLPVAERTLAEHLGQHGYATALVGKWHLGASPQHHPQQRGFDHFYGFLHEGHFFKPPPYKGLTTFLRAAALPDGGEGRQRIGDTVYSTHMGYDEPPYDEHNPILRGTDPVRESQYLTDAITREAVRFLEQPRDEPFFLYLSYNAVHSPLQARNETLEQLGHIDDIHRRVFAGMLVSLDEGVGKVLDTLRRRQLDRNTLVIFISDNGGPTRELTSSNAPLRGGKGTLFEGGLRVPFLMRWPGRLPAGRVESRPVIATDVFATACGAAGIELPSEPRLDSVDLLPFLSGENAAAPHPTLFWRMNRGAALRDGDWKLVRHRGRRAPSQDWQLFHLGQDLEETTDLAEQDPERLEQLVQKWEAWNDQMQPPAWRPR